VTETPPAPRARWWQPYVIHAAHRDVGGAIYGLILATALIAVSRRYQPDNSGFAAVTVVGTACVFWLAHVYAGVLEIAFERKRKPTWEEAQHILDEEFPLVQSGLLPTAILLLGPLGILADDTAQDLAIAACLVELAATGTIVAWVAGARWPVVLLSGAISLSFGLVVVALKVFVH